MVADLDAFDLRVCHVQAYLGFAHRVGRVLFASVRKGQLLLVAVVALDVAVNQFTGFGRAFLQEILSIVVDSSFIHRMTACRADF